MTIFIDLLSMMTKLLYLSDTYLFHSKARIQDVGTNEYGSFLILDQTVFYPQGGGQPFDTGKMISPKGEFQVSNVRLGFNGEVYHYGEFTAGNFEIGEKVSLEIDPIRRMQNAHIHTAGHLVDIAVSDLGITGLIPTKGFHSPEGSYVEYEGILTEPQQYKDPLEQVLETLVDKNLSILTQDLGPEEAQKRGVYAPEGKKARFVYFDTYESLGCGCGGTHVSKTGELGKVVIRKIKSKKGITRISYKVLEDV